MGITAFDRVSETVRAKWRRRQLASDTRAGRWAGRQAREQQHEYLRRNWQQLVLFACATLVMSPLLLLLPRWSRAFAAGLLLASAVWFVAFYVVLATGTGWKMIGDLGEQFTAGELRKFRRRGWYIVNSVDLRASGDIDHVALGAGGLFSFETKWIGSSVGTEWALDRRVDEAVTQASASAAWLFKMFSHDDIPSDARLTVVVLWGPGANGWNRPANVDDAVVLRGRDLRAWLSERPSDLLTAPAIARVWTKLDSTLQRRDDYDLQQEGAGPRSIGSHLARLFGVALSTMLGFVAAAEIVRIGAHAAVEVTLCFALVIAGVVARRWPSLESFASGWIFGTACATSLLLAGLVYSAAS